MNTIFNKLCESFIFKLSLYLILINLAAIMIFPDVTEGLLLTSFVHALLALLGIVVSTLLNQLKYLKVGFIIVSVLFLLSSIFSLIYYLTITFSVLITT